MDEIEPVPQRCFMSAKLQQAAIEGQKKDLVRLLGLTGVEYNHEHKVKVELLENDPMQFGTTEKNIEDIQSATYMGNTVLHILATYGHSDLLYMCYTNKQALLRTQNNKLETPLHCAAKTGHKQAISELIKLACSEGEVQLKEFLRAKNHNEETALHEAARHGHASVASVLMRADPDLAGIVNNEKISPLYMATARGSFDVVQIMVEKLSDREVAPAFFAGPNGQTALHAAVLRDAGRELQLELKFSRKYKSSSHKFTKLIMQLRSVKPLAKEADDTGSSPLQSSALSHKFTKLIMQLRSVKPLAKEADDTGSTPLHFVASVGCCTLTELLLKHDSSLAYLRNSDGLFPVHLAAYMGHVKTIIVFLRRCIDSSELLDNRGRNFFHVAAEENKYDVFVELLEKSTVKLGILGSDGIFMNMINTQDSSGNTPLQVAAQKGNKDVIAKLLKYKGSDLRLQNKEGLAAYDILTIQHYQKKINEGVQFSIIERYIRRWGDQFSPAWFKHQVVNKIIKPGLPKVEKSSLELGDTLQVVGLGSVLIATVAFTAAFTLPGGYNADNGTPVLGRKYAFKAFILADVLAFAISFYSTMIIIFCCRGNLNLHLMEATVKSYVEFFTLAAKCLALALAFGLYVVLAPVSMGVTIVAFGVLTRFLLADPTGYGNIKPRNVLDELPAIMDRNVELPAIMDRNVLQSKISVIIAYVYNIVAVVFILLFAML